MPNMCPLLIERAIFRVLGEATVVVPHCKLVVVLVFDAVAAYVVVLDSHVVVAFHLAVYLVAVAVLNPLGGIDVHVDVVLLVLPILQDIYIYIYIYIYICIYIYIFIYIYIYILLQFHVLITWAHIHNTMVLTKNTC